jgi:hypothetical protein
MAIVHRTNRIVILVLAVALRASAASAQDGTIYGVVRDDAGRPLSRVAVEARSKVLEQVLGAVSDVKGEFSLAPLPPGDYTLSFTLSGFDFPTFNQLHVDSAVSVVVAVAAIDEGCGHFRPETCFTSRQVAAGTPAAFRPLWDRGLGTADSESVRDDLPCESIAVRYSGGMVWTADSVRSFILRRDGRAELTLAQGADRAGTVNMWDFGKLCYLTERLGFRELAAHYAGNWSDGVGQDITVSSGGRLTSVSEADGVGPIELWALQQAIESVRRRIDWQQK